MSTTVSTFFKKYLADVTGHVTKILEQKKKGGNDSGHGVGVAGAINGYETRL